MLHGFISPVLPPSTDKATPAPLGKAMRRPVHNRLMSPRFFISDVGKLVELPQLISACVVHNLHIERITTVLSLICYLPDDKAPQDTQSQTDQFVLNTTSPQ
jgi:hypothetical protein